MLAGAALLGGSPAKADVPPLLTLTDTSALFTNDYTFYLTATETSTTISFQGYNMSDIEYVDNISFTPLDGGASLLGSASSMKTPGSVRKLRLSN